MGMYKTNEFPFPASFCFIFFFSTVKMFCIIFGDDWIQTATALSTEPQPPLPDQLALTLITVISFESIGLYLNPR